MSNCEARGRYRKKITKALIEAGVARDAPGRPKLEDTVPQLPILLLKITGHKCVADPRRRSEIVIHLGTISQVTEDLNKELEKIPELKRLNFKVSRSAVYTRFVPSNPTTYGGRRHRYCIPVRAARAQFNSRADHVSLQFCNARNRIAKQALS